jgi:hypothetical protein
MTLLFSFYLQPINIGIAGSAALGSGHIDLPALSHARRAIRETSSFIIPKKNYAK